MAIAQKAAKLVASMLLAILFALGGLIVLAPQDQIPPEPTSEEIVQIMEQIKEGTIEEDAKKQAGQFALVSAGDTCLMRHSKVLPGVDRKLRARLAAARLAEGRAGDAILDAAKAELSGLALWRAHMQTADVAIRNGQTQEAKSALNSALKSSDDIPDACLSDVDLSWARLARKTGDIEGALSWATSAAQRDPVHFNAQFERALVGTLASGRSKSNCAQSVRAMVESTIRLEALLKASSQIERLSENVARLETAERNKAFLLGFIEERRGRKSAARTVYLEGISAFAALQNAPCRPEMALALQMSLTRLDEGN